MRISKELKEKVERVFEAKKRESLRELEQNRDDRKKEIKEELNAELELLKQTNEFKKIEKFLSSPAEISAYKLNLYNPEIVEMDKSIKSIQNKIDLEQEDFLISLTYTKNIEEIKSLFSTHGLSF